MVESVKVRQGAPTCLGNDQAVANLDLGLDFHFVAFKTYHLTSLDEPNGIDVAERRAGSSSQRCDCAFLGLLQGYA